MQKINYQKQLEKEIKALDGERKKLLLHSCCAPCSSYVLEYLKPFFDITVLYYNPNIYPYEEFYKRSEEQKMLCERMGVAAVVIEEDPAKFYDVVKGYENEKEGGERCFLCYEMRLKKAADYAKENGFDYFCTTLSISPLKNAEKLNEIGVKIEKECGIKYLLSDFKKNNGYKRSVELSNEYGLYRQNYCGCVFSK